MACIHPGERLQRGPKVKVTDQRANQAFAVDASLITAATIVSGGWRYHKISTPAPTGRSASLWRCWVTWPSAGPLRSNPSSSLSLSRPRLTAAFGGSVVYAYANNYLIELKNAVIMDV